MLTEREQQILDLLRRDPLMGSEALAATLGTTRASINVHLSNPVSYTHLTLPTTPYV